jgi:predicted TPR repeat methyltransferase
MAMAWYKDAIKFRPTDPAANKGLARSLLLSGKREEAIISFKHCLELEPESLELRYFLDAAENRSPDIPPRNYVEGLFDSYASKFERHLLDNLEYQSPKVLHELIMESGDTSGGLSRAIDLGCGTGLSGDVFKDTCDTIIGVDLSRNMLLKAEKKGCYSELHQGDVAETVRQLNTVFDLYICADTLVYIGNLAPLFNAIGEHSKPGTLFVFSTELGSGDNFKLLRTGRYAHSKDYVQRVATDAGFSLVAFQDKPIRKEAGKWLTGGHYLFRYTKAS